MFRSLGGAIGAEPNPHLIAERAVRATVKDGQAMQLRVHELAKELGVSSRDLLLACSEYGEFVKSASSGLPPRIVEKLRADLGSRSHRFNAQDYGNSARTHSLADVGDGGFASAYEKARGASRISTYKSHEPGAIETAIYRYAINPGRVKKGRHTPEERDRAERLTRWWASTWLPDVVDWIELSHGEHRDVAVRLSQLGLTAADAALKLGFGRIDPIRAPIFERVASGTLGFKDAVLQVREFRLREQASGS